MAVQNPKPVTVESDQHHPHHYHLRRTAQRLRHLIHPDGRRIHIAQTPAEAEELKKSLSHESEDEITVCINGTDEHLEALRAIHAHHDEKRNELRQRQGEAFQQAEAVVLELEALSDELRHVTERSVQFDASFNKYGYSAHIRTHGDSPGDSSAVSIASGKTGQQTLEDWHALKFQGQPMKPFRKPILRQYFHQKLLWRAQAQEEVASYELFLDLIYVGIIAISGDSAAEEANGAALLRFAISFIMGWKIWTDMTQMINWFDQDDIMRRVLVLFTLACLVGFTTNINEYDTGAYAPFVAFYLAARLAVAAYYFWISWMIPMVFWPMFSNGVVIVIPSAIWIGSIYVEESKLQAAIWVALFLDIFGTFLTMAVRSLVAFSSRFRDWINHAWEFSPAQNIEHRIDRTGAFVTLVFGYSVVSLLYQSASHVGLNAFFGKAVCGLIQAFALNTLYFEIDSYNLHVHAIRRHYVSALVWFALHLPLILSYVIAGAALSRLVLVDDVPSASLEDLAEVSRAKSIPAIESGLRWFYTAGLGIGFLCLNIIAYSHSYRSPSLVPGAKFPWLFKRPWRFAVRFAVALAITFLGFADKLDSLQLIGTTTGLIALCLFVELIGNMITGCTKHLKRRGSALSGSTLGVEEKEARRHPGLKEWWSAVRTEMYGEGKCEYRARCHVTKRDLEARAEEGGRGMKVKEVKRLEWKTEKGKGG